MESPRDTDLNLDDGLHPNAKGVAAIVEAMLPKVEELLDPVGQEPVWLQVLASEATQLCRASSLGWKLPDDVRHRLARLKSPLPGAKWVEPENLHITLRFAGDVDNRVASEFADALSQIAMDAFEVRFSALGAFGGNDPRVLYAGIEPSPALEALARANERAARNAGLAPESRTFKPHVTLARLKYSNAEAIARYLGSHGEIPLPNRSWSSNSCCCRRGRIPAADRMWSKRSFRSAARIQTSSGPSPAPAAPNSDPSLHLPKAAALRTAHFDGSRGAQIASRPAGRPAGDHRCLAEGRGECQLATRLTGIQ